MLTQTYHTDRRQLTLINNDSNLDEITHLVK